jgi:hypothetical protein
LKDSGKTAGTIRFAAMLADGNNFCGKSLSYFSFGRRNSIQHLFLTSSSAILFDSCSGLDIMKCKQSSKPSTSDCEKTIFLLNISWHILV